MCSHFIPEFPEPNCLYLQHKISSISTLSRGEDISLPARAFFHTALKQLMVCSPHLGSGVPTYLLNISRLYIWFELEHNNVCDSHCVCSLQAKRYGQTDGYRGQLNLYQSKPSPMLKLFGRRALAANYRSSGDARTPYIPNSKDQCLFFLFTNTINYYSILNSIFLSSNIDLDSDGCGSYIGRGQPTTE